MIEFDDDDIRVKGLVDHRFVCLFEELHGYLKRTTMITIVMIIIIIGIKIMIIILIIIITIIIIIK